MTFIRLLDGMGHVFEGNNLLLLFIGVVLGMVVGVLPGIGAAATIAILLPVTLTLDKSGAVIMLAAVYYGAKYGGTITTVLMNTPGEAASVATAFDGYPLAKQGRAGPALVVSAFGALFAGVMGTLALTVLAAPLVTITRSLGPAELFLIVIIGLSLIVGLLGENRLYGLISALLGFALATIGADGLTGIPRFTFGSSSLLGGVSFQDVAVGLFGVGELFYCMAEGDHVRKYRIEQMTTRGMWPSRLDWVKSRFAIVRGSIIGFLIGVLPGAGATIAGLISYGVEKSVSKEPETFGKGAIAGVAGPESATNGSTVGSMVPMLMLGIPGSEATAILLGGFILWGLQPGPLFMSQQPTFAWTLIGSMLLGNLMLICLSLFAIRFFAAFMKIPYGIVIPVVVVLCVVGSYSVAGDYSDVIIMLIAGLVGYYMKRFGFSPGATVIALVLGPQAEATLRQTLAISNGSLSIFWDRTPSRAIILTMLFILGLLFLWRLHRKRQAAAGGSGHTSFVDRIANEVNDEIAMSEDLHSDDPNAIA